MANPFEQPPTKPEVAPRTCPHCGGSGKVKGVSCKPCNGSGKIRSNG